ncbi:hypothetical protein C8Q78DRAFT_1046387 [Trametes maxima]|nr:hypothetical protein C8Q78DRAFT_1046387 [Trametes maxima]
MGKRYKSKVYIESKDAAIELAQSVAGAQEQKSRAKVEARRPRVSARSTVPEDKRTTSSKARLVGDWSPQRALF